MTSPENETCVLLWRPRSERGGVWGWHPPNLRKNFSPQTVIDVGVGYGTPGLYEAFPEAHPVLIEPLQEHADRITELVRERGGEYHPVAVGDSEGPITIHVDPEALELSSVLRTTHRRPEATLPMSDRQIQMTTLDRLWESKGWGGPFGLKIDTEGYEQHVINGAARLLTETQFVIAEITVAKAFHGGYSFAEFISLMDSHRFVVCDIIDGLKNFQNGEIIQLDLFFRRAR